MHARLYIGNDPTKISEKIKNDTGMATDQLYSVDLKYIKDVRELSKATKLSSKKERVYLLKNIDKSSAEALNALLKMIEEPSEGVSFVLTARKTGGILPTILSRVQVIKINDMPDVKEDLSNFFGMSLSEKIKKIDAIKKREEATDFLEKIITYTHAQLKRGGSREKLKHQADRIKNAQVALNAINKNGNVSLHLSKFVIIIEER